MLTPEEIKRFIEDDSAAPHKQAARLGQRYYEARHDILNSRLFYYNADGALIEDTMRSNIRICHPFFTELADQLAAYILSFKTNPIRAVSGDPTLQRRLDAAFDDSFWDEISALITGAYVKGSEYLFAYKNAQGRLTFQCADALGVVEVRRKDTDDGCAYVIYWYVDRVDASGRAIRRIQVWNDRETAFYVQSGGGAVEPDASQPVNPRPHVVYIDEQGRRMAYGLGYVPFWRLDNGKKRMSGLTPVKALIDDYDIMECGLSNNLADFDTPLYVVTGYQGSNLDELQHNLRTRKIVGVDSEGGVRVQTVDIPYQARKLKADEDEKNIYRFGMGLDMRGLRESGATTNLAIRAAYTLLELKAGKMEKALRRLLRRVIPLVLAEINGIYGSGYQDEDVAIVFEHSILANAEENARVALVEAQTRQTESGALAVAAPLIGEDAARRGMARVWGLEIDG